MIEKIKVHLNNFTQAEKNIYFFLLVNLGFNFFMYYKTKDEYRYNNEKELFPFSSYYDSLFEQYYNVYSGEELVLYGITPLLIFYVWFYFFKGKK